MKNKNDVFDGLFVLELANNHLGNLDRGLNMIDEFAQVVRYNNIKAAIKLQFRDIETFVHPKYSDNQDINYIKKITDKKLSKEEYFELIKRVVKVGCIPMSTPFDESSVDLCDEFNLPIIKIASSDINSWPLLERVAKSKKPVILSNGGSSLKGMDDAVSFFQNRDIPLALNHCVSLYPSEDSDLELNQIDFLKERYPDVTIGFSTHEYTDWESSIKIAYAKGARTFERHIDTPEKGYKPKVYNSNSSQINTWFSAYKKAKEMCGGSSDQKRIVSKKVTEYLDALLRGVYVRKKIKQGLKITNENFDEYFYLSVPLFKGQLSSREIITGIKIIKDLNENDKLELSDIESSYNKIESIKKTILNRGI